MDDISVLNLFLEAGMVVKTVMVILLIASLLTWIIIVERYNFYKKIRVINDSFLERFWSGEDLNLLYSEIKTETVPVYGALSVFKNSFKEFLQIDQTNEITELDLEGINRSMRVAIASDEEEMNKHLAFLANVGSVSPYIGLFGTVWGIMNAFIGLSKVAQATLSQVAPGIAEALIATAIGLFAAIPAVIAYNRFAAKVDRLSLRFESFMEEFINIVDRKG